LPPEDIAALRATYAAERAGWNQPVIPLASVTDAVLELPAGGVGVRFYRASDAAVAPTLVYLHGGGFVVGSLDTHDRIMRQLCSRSGAVVVGVDYPLAPEHPHPAALDVVEAVLVELASRAGDHGIDPARLAIGGDSAGAFLALAATVRRPNLIRFMLLYYGLYGLRDGRSRRRFTAPDYGLTPADLSFYEACYLAGGVDHGVMDVLAADPSGLPPAFIGAAALDPLLDDSLALADRLPNAELRVYDGMRHGFLHWSREVPLAVTALEDGARALVTGLVTPAS
jgi:acetyl esterase